MRALLLARLVFLAPPAALAQVLSLPDLQGRVHRLSDYRGKVVLLNFRACQRARLVGRAHARDD